MSIKYTLEFKKEVVKEYATGRSFRDISETYNVPQATLAGWIKKYNKECLYEKPQTKEILGLKEQREFQKRIAELEKENTFFKKTAAFFAKKIELIKEGIKTIYYHNSRLLGQRGMRIFLARKGITLNKTTVFKYMNKELRLFAITQPKKVKYRKGIIHKTFENTLNQKFTVSGKNQIWCTDFTYIRLKTGKMRYNCSILDLYDRSIVASLNSRPIDIFQRPHTYNNGLSPMEKRGAA